MRQPELPRNDPLASNRLKEPFARAHVPNRDRGGTHVQFPPTFLVVGHSRQRISKRSLMRSERNGGTHAVDPAQKLRRVPKSFRVVEEHLDRRHTLLEKEQVDLFDGKIFLKQNRYQPLTKARMSKS